MKKLIPAGKSLLVGAVAVGALSFGTVGIGTVGIASAATPTPRHFNCARAAKTLTRIEKQEARIAARLPKLEANETKAVAKGKTARAARLEQRIDRIEHSALKTRLTNRSASIEASCKVSAPPAS